MNEQDLRVRAYIANVLPDDALASRPRDALAFFPLVLLAIGCTAAILSGLPLYLNLLLSLVLGNTYAAFFCFGHYLGHGSIVRTKWLKDLMLYPCFWMLGLSPHLWTGWHHSMHHPLTNLPGKDPDNFGTLAHQSKRPIPSILIPGNGRILPTLLFLLTFFTGHVLMVLFVFSKSKYARLNRRRAFLETAGIFGSIGLLAYFSGMRAIYTVLIPWLIANIITVSYTMTQHLLCPAPPMGGVLESTMSVRVPKWIDWMHFYNSHHVEHHLFPEAPLRTLPKIRKLLTQFSFFKCPVMWRSLLAVYYTPRFHSGDKYLVDWKTNRRVSYRKINKVLFNGDSFESIKP